MPSVIWCVIIVAVILLVITVIWLVRKKYYLAVVFGMLMIAAALLSVVMTMPTHYVLPEYDKSRVMVSMSHPDGRYDFLQDDHDLEEVFYEAIRDLEIRYPLTTKHMPNGWPADDHGYLLMTIRSEDGKRIDWYAFNMDLATGHMIDDRGALILNPEKIIALMNKQMTAR